MSTDPISDWSAIIAHRKIQEAMDAGEFDNLAGKGKPLNLEEYASEPPGQRILNKILKESGALPEWAEYAREIEKEINAVPAAKERGLRAISLARNEPSRVHATERLRSDYKERMSGVNSLILKYTLTVPGPVQRPFRTFRIREEMERLEAEIASSP